MPIGARDADGVRSDAEGGRHLLDRFWDIVTEGSPLDDAVVGRLREIGTPELPAQPTPEQLDAWIELAELASDEDFQRTTRANAEWLPHAARGEFDAQAFQDGMARATRFAAEAMAAGIEPQDPRARPVVDVMADACARALHREDGPAFRAWLAEQAAAHADPRAARYWELVSIVRGDRPAAAAHVTASPGRWLWETISSSGAHPDAADDRGTRP